MIRIVRLGSARVPGEGLRIGTVRRPPRGIPRTRYAKDDWYDIWLPDVAPSADLVKQALGAATEREWRAFVRRYRAELAAPERARIVALLAALSRDSHFSVGCYCEDEARCHRSVLRQALAAQGAVLAPG